MAEAEGLAAARPRCHGCRNEIQSGRFICALREAGYPQTVEMVEKCLVRLRIAVGTGRYPQEMLSTPADASEPCSNLALDKKAPTICADEVIGIRWSKPNMAASADEVKRVKTVEPRRLRQG